MCSKVDKKRCDRVWSVHGLGSGFFFTSGSMRTQVSVFRRGHPLTSSQTVLTTFFDFCPFPATFEAVFRGLSKACILRKSSGLSRSKYSSCNALSLKTKNLVSHPMSLIAAVRLVKCIHTIKFIFLKLYATSCSCRSPSLYY